MYTIYYSPHPAIFEYVETVCVMAHVFAPGDALSPIYTYKPTHTSFLCFYIKDSVKAKKGSGAFEDRAQSIIIGPQLTRVTLDVGKNTQM